MFLAVQCMNGVADWIPQCQEIACIPHDVIRITTVAYNAIRIIAPLVLIIIGMFDMAKAVTAGKEDDIKKAQQLLVKKAIAAAVVFLLFSLVTFALNILSKSDSSISKVATCVKTLLGEEN